MPSLGSPHSVLETSRTLYPFIALLRFGLQEHISF